MPVLTQPLSDTELDRLDDFLQTVNPGEGMSLEELDGFFCALICSPEVVPPSEYMPHIFGGELVQGGGVSTIEEAQELLDLLTRHWNTIAATLLRGEPHAVLMGEFEDGSVTGQEWALGFQQGMYMRHGSWERLASDEKLGAALLPMIVLAEDGEHQLTSDPVTPEEREAMLDVLADSVLLVYQYFRGTLKPRNKFVFPRCASENCPCPTTPSSNPTCSSSSAN
jgi:uncharacterized protein